MGGSQFGRVDSERQSGAALVAVEPPEHIIRSGIHHVPGSQCGRRTLITFYDRAQNGSVLIPQARLTGGVGRREQHRRPLAQIFWTISPKRVLRPAA